MIMSFEIEVENIKCGGCGGSIVKGLQALEGVTTASVDVERGCVIVVGDIARRAVVAERLQQLGYPEVGSVTGLTSAKAKAKSFVSCAVGRFSDSSPD
jgi:copper chaperone